jgi:di/tricarboxylate transporter
MLDAPRQARAGLALLILAGMLVGLIFNLLPLAALSLLAGLLLVLTGAISLDEAYQTIDWKSIVLVASMLPMSTALERVDLVNLAAQGVTVWLGPLGPLAVLAALFAITSLFSQVLSNTATTVLIAPIAFASATSLGVQPQAFLMAVALAASMAFASPVASPVNTLVMAAGDYRFSDYVRTGLPLILLALVVSILALPVFFPF